MTNAYMICTDGFSEAFCLIDGILCELKRVEPKVEEYPEDEPDD